MWVLFVTDSVSKLEENRCHIVSATLGALPQSIVRMYGIGNLLGRAQAVRFKNRFNALVAVRFFYDIRAADLIGQTIGHDRKSVACLVGNGLNLWLVFVFNTALVAQAASRRLVPGDHTLRTDIV